MGSTNCGTKFTRYCHIQLIHTVAEVVSIQYCHSVCDDSRVLEMIAALWQYATQFTLIIINIAYLFWKCRWVTPTNQPTILWFVAFSVLTSSLDITAFQMSFIWRLSTRLDYCNYIIIVVITFSVCRSTSRQQHSSAFRLQTRKTSSHLPRSSNASPLLGFASCICLRKWQCAYVIYRLAPK